MNKDPQIGDIIMLMKAEVKVTPVKHGRGRPPKKPRVETETTWHDDIEAIVISGPNQGISSDGEDYWLEWNTKRLDNGMNQVICTRRQYGTSFRILHSS